MMTKKHIVHHYALTISALVISFIGLFLLKASYTGNITEDTSSVLTSGITSSMTSKWIVAVVILLGAVIFLEKARHKK